MRERIREGREGGREQSGREGEGNWKWEGDERRKKVEG